MLLQVDIGEERPYEEGEGKDKEIIGIQKSSPCQIGRHQFLTKYLAQFNK